MLGLFPTHRPPFFFFSVGKVVPSGVFMITLTATLHGLLKSAIWKRMIISFVKGTTTTTTFVAVLRLFWALLW